VPALDLELEPEPPADLTASQAAAVDDAATAVDAYAAACANLGYAPPRPGTPPAKVPDALDGDVRRLVLESATKDAPGDQLRAAAATALARVDASTPPVKPFDAKDREIRSDVLGSAASSGFGDFQSIDPGIPPTPAGWYELDGAPTPSAKQPELDIPPTPAGWYELDGAPTPSAAPPAEAAATPDALPGGEQSNFQTPGRTWGDLAAPTPAAIDMPAPIPEAATSDDDDDAAAGGDAGDAEQRLRDALGDDSDDSEDYAEDIRDLDVY